MAPSSVTYAVAVANENNDWATNSPDSVKPAGSFNAKVRSKRDVPPPPLSNELPPPVASPLPCSSVVRISECCDALPCPWKYCEVSVLSKIAKSGAMASWLSLPGIGELKSNEFTSTRRSCETGVKACATAGRVPIPIRSNDKRRILIGLSVYTSAAAQPNWLTRVVRHLARHSTVSGYVNDGSTCSQNWLRSNAVVRRGST